MAVFRGEEGLTITVDIAELVVGDIIQIEQGMKLPTDCLLLEGTDISADEAAMTGEPDQMEKTAVTDITYEQSPDPFLLGKTLVNQGQGIALVCCVGPNSRAGQAEEKLQTEEDQTPLQAKLDTIASQLSKVGTLFFVIALILGIGRCIFERIPALGGSKTWSDQSTLKDFLSAVITSVTVIVIAVPEGLPLAVTISFAFSVNKMKKENNWVRKLASSETMGGAN